MNFVILLSFVTLLTGVAANDPTSDVVEPNQDDTMQSPSKEAVVQHPVTVSVGAPQPMTTKPPMAPLKTRVVVVHNNMVPVPIECFQPPDSGTCSKDMARVYYDHETRTCKPFSYTGCGGNANRFQSIKNCYRICHPYRYKIRPKVAHSQQQALKVRALPAQTNMGAANMASMQAAQARSLLGQQQQQAQARSLMAQAPQQRSMYGNPYQQQSPYGQQYYAQGGAGGQIVPLTQRHVVMTSNGPQVKNQQVGQGSPLPHNSGSMGGEGTGGHHSQGSSPQSPQRRSIANYASRTGNHGYPGGY